MFHYQLWHFLRASFVTIEFRLFIMFLFSSPTTFTFLLEIHWCDVVNKVWWITIHHAVLSVLVQLFRNIISIQSLPKPGCFPSPNYTFAVTSSSKYRPLTPLTVELQRTKERKESREDRLSQGFVSWWLCVIWIQPRCVFWLKLWFQYC